MESAIVKAHDRCGFSDPLGDSAALALRQNGKDIAPFTFDLDHQQRIMFITIAGFWSEQVVKDFIGELQNNNSHCRTREGDYKIVCDATGSAFNGRA